MNPLIYSLRTKSFKKTLGRLLVRCRRTREMAGVITVSGRIKESDRKKQNCSIYN